MEKHHVAGRRKAAFCFYVLLHTACHRHVHQNPRSATADGLLWPGRNSKELTVADARELVLKMPYPAHYSIPILETYQHDLQT